MDHSFVQPVGLELHPDLLVHFYVVARLDGVHAVGVGVCCHGQVVIPFSRCNLLDRSAGMQSYLIII